MIAYYFTNPPEKPSAPTGLRAPELVVGGPFNTTFDIWTFGCLVFELVAGRPLFPLPFSFGKDDEDPAEREAETNDDLLIVMTGRLGALPDELSSRWDRSSRYFDQDGKWKGWGDDHLPKGQQRYEPDLRSVEQAFDETRPDVDDAEAAQIKSLVRWILNYDPAKRPSADEILRHPWFSED